MEQTATRFLSPRLALLLALSAVLMGLSSTWITGALGAWLPFSGTIPLTSLPHILCGIAVVLAALIAPLANQPGAPRPTLTQLIFAGLFQGAMYQFFMMVTARLVPIDPTGMVLSALGLALTAFCCLLIAEAAPRAYSGIVFFWIVAVPLVCYMTADIFLTGPGSAKGWQAGESSALIYSATHALLMLSPPTALAAMLDGAVPDGTAVLPAVTLGTFGALSAVLILLRLRGQRIAKSAAELQPARG